MARKEAGKSAAGILTCGVDAKTIFKMAALYAGALVVTIIIKFLFGLGFGAGMIVFFAALLAGWKLAYPNPHSAAEKTEISTGPDEDPS